MKRLRLDENNFDELLNYKFLYIDVLQNGEVVCKGVNRRSPDYFPIEHLEIPEGVTHIGKFAFLDYLALKSVKFPSTLTCVSLEAFSGCDNLEEVRFSSSTECRILRQAFAGCFSLQELDLGSVTYIGDQAFVGCKNLKSVVIPRSVKCIDKFAFDACRGLETVTFEGDLETIDISYNAFFGTPYEEYKDWDIDESDDEVDDD